MKNLLKKYIIMILLILPLNSCANNSTIQIGKGSWYGKKFQGKRTANGERFNMYAYTAAHRSLPFNTMVRVTNLKNNRSIIVRINDRGPYSRGRIIDLSYLGAKKLGYMKDGVGKLKIEILKTKKRTKR